MPKPLQDPNVLIVTGVVLYCILASAAVWLYVK